MYIVIRSFEININVRRVAFEAGYYTCSALTPRQLCGVGGKPCLFNSHTCNTETKKSNYSAQIQVCYYDLIRIRIPKTIVCN